MLQDILEVSWAYQELMEKGRQDARQQELRRLRQILVDIVLGRFPKIVRQVQKHIDMIDDPELLASLIVKISLTRRPKVVTKLLVSLNGDDEHH